MVLKRRLARWRIRDVYGIAQGPGGVWSVGEPAGASINGHFLDLEFECPPDMEGATVDAMTTHLGRFEFTTTFNPPITVEFHGGDYTIVQRLEWINMNVPRPRSGARRVKA